MATRSARAVSQDAARRLLWHATGRSRAVPFYLFCLKTILFFPSACGCTGLHLYCECEVAHPCFAIFPSTVRDSNIHPSAGRQTWHRNSHLDSRWSHRLDGSGTGDLVVVDVIDLQIACPASTTNEPSDHYRFSPHRPDYVTLNGLGTRHILELIIG